MKVSLPLKELSLYKWRNLMMSLSRTMRCLHRICQESLTRFRETSLEPLSMFSKKLNLKTKEIYEKHSEFSNKNYQYLKENRSNIEAAAQSSVTVKAY